MNDVEFTERPSMCRPQFIISVAAVVCAISVFCALPAAANVHGASASQAPAAASSAAAPAKKRVPHSQREELYFARRYGIGQLRMRSIAEGASLEFRCQVLDAVKAKALNDNRIAPVMIERKTGAKLSVVNTENNGKPLQRTLPEAGQEYWMVFGNRGRVVKPGNMVDLVIGTVHISGLIVE
jgi:hypothetical protein